MQYSDLENHPTVAKILYAPVDLGPVPEIDFNALTTWFLATQEERARQEKAALPIKTQVNVCIAEDYATTGIMQCPLYDGIHDGWYGLFNLRFPEVARYLEQFPFKNPQIGIRITDGDHPAMAPEKVPHTDVDVEVLTMRVYLHCDDQKRLHFREIKKPYKKYHYERLGAGDAIPLHHLHPEKHFANTLPEPHAWVLGNIGSPHAVNHVGVKGRSVIKITGEWDIERAIALFEDSLVKYKDNVLLIDQVNIHG